MSEMNNAEIRTNTKGNPMENTKTHQGNQFSVSFGVAFMGYAGFIWVSSLVKEWGYVVYRGRGLATGIGLLSVIILCALGIDLLMAKLNIQKQIRSAVWFAAFIGPYVGVMGVINWESPVLSHIAGVASVLAGFILSWFIDGRLKKRK